MGFANCNGSNLLSDIHSYSFAIKLLTTDIPVYARLCTVLYELLLYELLIYELLLYGELLLYELLIYELLLYDELPL